jgi:hypothetical protein
MFISIESENVVVTVCKTADVVNGSINNIDMTGAIPTGVDTRKHYSYDISGRINEITYSTP